MTETWLHMFKRWIAAVVMVVGGSGFCLGLLAGFPILMEGVTGLVGEGERLSPESEDRIRFRLTVVSCFLGAAPVGWVLARLGDCYRRKDSGDRLSAAQLIAEFLLVASGVALALAFLIWRAPQANGYEPDEVYRQIYHISIGVGPACLLLGFLLFRWSRPI